MSISIGNSVVDIDCSQWAVDQHWAYVETSERSLQGCVVHLHDYPPLSGGGLALTVRELIEVSGRPDVHVIAATRLKDHYGDDSHVEVMRVECKRLINEAAAVVLHLTYSPRTTHGLMDWMVAGNIPFHVVLHCRETHVHYGSLAEISSNARYCALEAINKSLATSRSIRCFSPSQARNLSERLSRKVLAAPLLTVDIGIGSNSGTFEENLVTAGELSILKGTDRIPALGGALARRIKVFGHGDQRWSGYLKSFGIHHRPTLSRHHLANEIDRSIGVLIPSRSESWSRIAAEALWLGRPVATATQLGVLEWVESLTGMALGFDVAGRDQSVLGDEFRDFLYSFSRAAGIESINALNGIARLHWQQFFAEIIQ